MSVLFAALTDRDTGEVLDTFGPCSYDDADWWIATKVGAYPDRSLTPSVERLKVTP